jgi:predicted glycoside hydrolase/deacetylase ChbG (UPF0249 family)
MQLRMLHVVADDFGRTEERDAGILELHAQGSYLSHAFSL